MNKKLFYLLFAAISAFCLFSCTSAPKHLAKAIAKDKPYVAEQTRILWPCVVTARDTVNTTDTVYDLIESVPDTEYITKYKGTGYVRVDTVYRQRTITNNQVVFEKVKDSSEVWLCLNNAEVQDNINKENLAKKDKIIDKQQDTITDQDKRIKRKNKRLMWLWVVIAALGIWTVRKPLFRLIKPV